MLSNCAATAPDVPLGVENIRRVIRIKYRVDARAAPVVHETASSRQECVYLGHVRQRPFDRSEIASRAIGPECETP